MKLAKDQLIIFFEHLNTDVWQSAKELCDNVHNVPHDMIFETQQNIEDTIQLLNLARLGLEGKKQ